MDKRVPKQTKQNLKGMITLLEKCGRELEDRKPYWSSVCFSSAVVFETAFDQRFRRFEFESLSHRMPTCTGMTSVQSAGVAHVRHSPSMKTSDRRDDVMNKGGESHHVTAY